MRSPWTPRAFIGLPEGDPREAGRSLASEQDGPLGIAIDASNVYWTNGASVMKVPKSGGTPTKLASTQGAVTLAVEGDSVYWTETASEVCSAVVKVPVDGGQTTTLSLGPRVLGVLGALAVDSTGVYWGGYLQSGGGVPLCIGGDTGDSPFTTETLVVRVPLSGGQPITLFSDMLNLPPEGAFNSMFVDATSVYWAGGSRVERLTPK